MGGRTDVRLRIAVDTGLDLHSAALVLEPEVGVAVAATFPGRPIVGHE